MSDCFTGMIGNYLNFERVNPVKNQSYFISPFNQSSFLTLRSKEVLNIFVSVCLGQNIPLFHHTSVE